ncbi:TnsA endonuclease N-terminal domain-containing protein [Pseudomonas sp. RW10S2]|uniref:TnsA endonuclease N-terminal domain-containing protein n=1 Tax=Pseudomonas sp. RW10S2 TaxID=459637 RepID=UPI0016493537|nr:TnsA endonuclease N-terminal domain-containing protein [Pseudomonas sp. RW10S2]MBC3465447.1 transposase [Pseudomonas sp. RW10S2]
MTVRKVVTRRSNHFRGYFPSLKNQKPVPWESQLEGAFFRLLELSPAVISYVVQPSEERVPSAQGYFKYYPDVRVFLSDGRDWWFEVKPEERLNIARVRDRLETAERHFISTGRNFSVVTDKLIEEEPLASNLRRLMSHRRGPVLSGKKLEEVLTVLNDQVPKTVSDLLLAVGERPGWRLLGMGIVGIELNKPLDTDSPIFLQGGHRHADLFP